MNCKIELGAWNSVFAVPSELVDKHLKLAGAVQLKVILWILRHSGENITTDDLAKSLNMQEADVRDSLSYWSETGLVTLDEGIIVPPAEQTKSESEPVILQDTAVARLHHPEAIPSRKSGLISLSFRTGMPWKRPTIP